MTNYLEAGHQERLWDAFADWTQAHDFDYAEAGARMLGHDIALLLDANGRTRLMTLLAAQTNMETPGALPVEMNRQRPEQAIRLLSALLRGLTEQYA